MRIWVLPCAQNIIRARIRFLPAESKWCSVVVASCACCVQYIYALRILTLMNTYNHGIMHTVHINTKNIHLESNYCNYNKKNQ